MRRCSFSRWRGPTVDRRSVGVGPGRPPGRRPGTRRAARWPGTGRGRRQSRWIGPVDAARVTSRGRARPAPRPRPGSVRRWESELNTTIGWSAAAGVDGPTGELGQGTVGRCARPRPMTSGVVTCGVLVDPVDARSGDDVVELVEEQRASRAASSGSAGIVGPRAREAHSSASRRANSARRLSRLVARLGGVGAAVGLEVELARPRRRGPRCSASASVKKARAPSMVSRGMPSSRPGAGPTRASHRSGHPRRRPMPKR